MSDPILTPEARVRLRTLCEQAEPACCGHIRQISEFEGECCGDPDYPVMIEARELPALLDLLDDLETRIGDPSIDLAPCEAQFTCPHCGCPSAGTKEQELDIHAGATYRCDQCGGEVIFSAQTPAQYVASCQQEARIRELENALIARGRHEYGCPSCRMAYPVADDCTCGLSAALRQRLPVQGPEEK